MKRWDTLIHKKENKWISVFEFPDETDINLDSGQKGKFCSISVRLYSPNIVYTQYYTVQ